MPLENNMTPRLEMRGISKTFPGVRALNGVQIKAWGGEVLALMGENGAGKSTLMKVLSGAYQADPGGEILIDGKPVSISDPIAAKHHGISIIYQELALAPNLTVAENIYLGTEPSRGGSVDRKAMRAGCQSALDRLGTPFTPDTIVGTCPSRSSSLLKSPEPYTRNRKFLCWMNRRPRCHPVKPTGCSHWSASFVPRALR